MDNDNIKDSFEMEVKWETKSEQQSCEGNTER
jgi:hypothetical protein